MKNYIINLILTSVIKRDKYNLLFLLVVFTILFWRLIVKLPAYDDEPAHFQQISSFYSGHFKIIPGMTVIPFYHIIIASVAVLSKNAGLSLYRFVNFIFTLANIYIFYLLAGILDRNNRNIKTLLFAFFPVFFPYRFLLYVENLSALFILFALYAYLGKKFFVCFVFAFFAFLTKQTNIIWYLFFITLLYLEQHKHLFSLKLISLFMRRFYYFFTGLTFIFLFLFINGGVAIKAKNDFPDFYLSSGNLYWALFLYSVFFSPVIFSQIAQIKNFIATHGKIIIFMALFVTSAFFTFENSHPWNNHSEHLRNIVLMSVASGLWIKLLFFSLVSLAVVSLSFTDLVIRKYNIFYIFAAFSLLPFWLIESRYSFMAFVFFMLFRKITNPKYEIIMLFLFIIVSLIFYNGYINRIFYL